MAQHHHHHHHHEETDGLTYEVFIENIREIVDISNRIQDGWQLVTREGLDNGGFMTKRVNQILRKSHNGTDGLMVKFEYHVVYNINYGVPVLCFTAWKQDGSLLHMDEYFQYNTKLQDDDVLSTLTQLDHPVLCKPFLTFHPCRTRDILDSFESKSKNLVVSWLSVITPFLDMELHDDYIKTCCI